MTTLTPSPTRTDLPSLDAGVEYFPEHTEADRDIAIEWAVFATNAVSCYLPPSNSYVGFLDDRGRVVAQLQSGLVTVLDYALGGAVPAGAVRMASTGFGSKGYDIHLSTYNARPNGPVEPEPARGEICERHWIERAVNGTCDLCE